MIGWLLPIAVAAVASPPPLPPLLADQVAAARRLVAANPPSAATRDFAIKVRIENAADRALAAGKVTTRNVTRWAALRERLVKYYNAQLGPRRAVIDDRVTECLVNHFAGMAAADTDAATAFFSSPPGQRTWPVIADQGLVHECSFSVVGDDLIDFRGGMVAAGLKPPPLPDPRVIMY